MPEQILSSVKSSDIPPLQSDDRIKNVLQESNQYLDAHDETVLKIFAALHVFYDVTDLIPVTSERLLTGYRFPITEAATSLENSIQFCKMGFYKQAHTELRSVLELGLFSVYLELDGGGHINIQDWLHSRERTPVIRKIISELTTNKNIMAFDDKHAFCNKITALYDDLSRFVHTRGQEYSHRRLSRSNINRFNEESLSVCLDLFFKVVDVVVTAYVLKYPVALQSTPLYQKFGQDYPLGLCLDVDQSTALKKFLDKDVLKTLQVISDSDVGAVELAQLINDQPDLSPEKLQQQTVD